MKKILLTESQYKKVLKEEEDFSTDGGFRNFINAELKGVGINTDIKDMDDKEKKLAKRKLALKYHPDKNPTNPKAATAKFTKISTAFDMSDNPRNYQQTYDSGRQSYSGQQGQEPFQAPFGAHAARIKREFQEMKRKQAEEARNYTPPPPKPPPPPTTFMGKIKDMANDLKITLGDDWANLKQSLEDIFDLVKGKKITQQEANKRAQERIKRAQEKIIRTQEKQAEKIRKQVEKSRRSSAGWTRNDHSWDY